MIKESIYWYKQWGFRHKPLRKLPEKGFTKIKQVKTGLGIFFY